MPAPGKRPPCRLGSDCRHRSARARSGRRRQRHRTTYLALGDSLAYGYHQAQFQEELKTKGFVEAKHFNDGPAFCAGGPTGSPFPKAFLHHSYPGTQLEDALAIAKEPGVGTITLDIGANDILQFLSHTCGFPATFTCSQEQIEAEIGHVTANVGSILAQLRAAAPEAKIIFVSQYNPNPTVLKPEGTGDIPTVCAFTAMCPGGVFNPASPNADIHPTKAGYAAMAGVVGVAYLSH